MDNNYKEQLVHLVITASEDGTHATAEFIVLGEYINKGSGLPAAKGQK